LTALPTRSVLTNPASSNLLTALLTSLIPPSWEHCSQA